MPPMSRPEKTSCPTVVIGPAQDAAATRGPRGNAAAREGMGSARAPVRQGRPDRPGRRELLREDLVVAGLLPLPHADRGAQVLAGVLRIDRPIVVGELDAAAVREATLGQVELERDVAQLRRLVRLGL